MEKLSRALGKRWGGRFHKDAPTVGSGGPVGSGGTGEAGANAAARAEAGGTAA